MRSDDPVVQVIIAKDIYEFATFWAFCVRAFVRLVDRERQA